jgi:hypothetical protein
MSGNMARSINVRSQHNINPTRYAATKLAILEIIRLIFEPMPSNITFISLQMEEKTFEKEKCSCSHDYFYPIGCYVELRNVISTIGVIFSCYTQSRKRLGLDGDSVRNWPCDRNELV